MKHALKFSLILNLGLGSGLIFLLATRHARLSAPNPAITAETTPPVNETVAAPPPAAPEAQSKPFRWNQMESTDYHTYIRNLRGIGCPEPALRAIVTADVHAVFGKRSRELEQQLAALADASWSVRLSSVNTEPALKAEMLKLPGEEAAEINELLGVTEVPDHVAAAESSSPQDSGPSQADSPVPMPLVFQNINPAAMDLTSDQLQVINNVRQSFLDEIGGTNQDPNDPAYLDRWQKALPEADAMLRGMLGVTFFENYQLAATGNSQ